MDVMHKGSHSRITIPTEPAFLALGPNHLAVGMNNRVDHLSLQLCLCLSVGPCRQR